MHSAELECLVCGERTHHRILRVDASSRPDRLSGIARCTTCRVTHPFEERTRPTGIPVHVIVSHGPESRAEERTMPAEQVLAVGDPIPGISEDRRIRRIEGRDGRARSSARAAEVGALWVAAPPEPRLLISVLDGGRTFGRSIPVAAERRLAVGEVIEVERQGLRVVALRARGRTWSRVGDRFAAAEIERAYARRTAIPPAGSRGWSSSRPTPSSRARLRSAPSRSRSSPGESRNRKRPRASMALAGATASSRSPS